MRSNKLFASAAVLAGLAMAGTSHAVVLINEVDADQTGTDADEFVELYNTGASAVDLSQGGDAYVLVLYNGSDDASYDAIELTGSIPAGGYYVVGSGTVANVDQTEFTTNGIQNGADGVGLFSGASTADFPNDTAVTARPAGTTLVDAIVYDTSDGDDTALISGLGVDIQVDEDAGDGGGDADTESRQRQGDGAGGAFTWSSSVTATPTPGAANPTPPASASLTGAYSVDGDTLRVIFDIDPSPVVSGDFSLTDSQSSASVNSVSSVDATTYDLELSAALTDTSNDTIDYTPNSNPQTFVGGLTDVTDIRAGSGDLALGAVVTLDVAVVAVDGNDVALQERGGTSQAGIILFDGGVGGTVAPDEDIVIAGEVSDFTDGGGSTRLQLNVSELISNAGGAALTPVSIPSTDFLFDNPDGSAPAENYEGMLIQINENLTITDYLKGFGESDLEDPSSNVLVIDDTFFDYSGEGFGNGTVLQDVTGVAWESFGDYKIQPRDANDLTEVTSVSDWMILH